MGKDFLHVGTRVWQPLGPAERVFLLNGLRAAGDPPLPPATLDWATLTRRLRSDGLAPHFYRLYRDTPELLPADVYKALKHAYYQNASANHIRLQELRRLGGQLGAAGIRLLVLKGAALAMNVYGDPALRFMGDVDVVAPPTQTQAALACLLAEGYTLHDDALTNPALLREKGWHLRLTRPVRGKEIELEFHWPLRERVLVSQTAELDVQQLWAAAVPLDEAANLWQPAPAHTLLYLCLHTGLQHRFADLGLRQYVDVDLVVRRCGDAPGFWPAFVTAARAARARHVSYFCLHLAQQMLDTPLPAGALAPLRPPRWKRRLFGRRFRIADAANRTRAFYDRRRLWWRLLTLDRPGDVLAGPWRQLFPGRAYLASYYGTQRPAHLAAYAAWHPLHALARAGRRRLQDVRSRGRGA